MPRIIDHIVYCVPDLEEAIDTIADKLGVRPSIGGRHLHQGTRNALLNLGDQCYLELLATDHENETVKARRWMGIDLIDAPSITRWSLKSSDIAADSRLLTTYDPTMGTIHTGQRMTTKGDILIWQMTLPLPEPAVELAPFFTDWSASAMHPTDSLAGMCTLDRIAFYHPNPHKMMTLFASLDIDLVIERAAQAAIHVYIRSPKGIIKL